MITPLLILLLLLLLWLLLSLGERTVRLRKPLAIPGLEERSLKHKGRNRTFLLYRPPDLPTEQVVPLVFVLHGGGGNAKAIFRRSGMHEVAKTHGFIAVYPDGTGHGSTRLNWNAGSSSPQGYAEEHNVDDVDFVRKLLRELDKEFAVDANRVYAAGMSKGGMLAYRLACEMSRQFAAIAAVSSTLTYRQCRPRMPVSVLHVHGEYDENVPLAGGKGRYTAAKNFFPPVWEGLRAWLQHNECADNAVESRPAPDTTCWRYTHCAEGTEVALCIVQGGGHAWPGPQAEQQQMRRGQYVSTQFNASDYIYRFFQQHSRNGSDRSVS